MSEVQTAQNSQEAREKAKQELKAYGGLSTVSKTLAQQLKLPNLKHFGSDLKILYRH